MYCNYILSLLCILILSPSLIYAQETYFFQEGTDSNYYNQAALDFNLLGESVFENTYAPGYPDYPGKIPCSTNAYKGSTSLKFNYTSSANGNWKVHIHRSDWSAANIVDYDTLSFYLYSENGLPKTALPQVGIVCAGYNASKLYSLADYNKNIPAKVWTKITFPLPVICEDYENIACDFSRVEGIVFNQSENNDSSRLFFLDDLLVYKNMEVIPTVSDLKVIGYDSHAELNWAHTAPSLTYRVYASYDNGQSYELRKELDDNYYLDFVPGKAKNSTVSYKVVSVFQDIESQAATGATEIRDFSDDELLDMMQRYTFRYFWEGTLSGYEGKFSKGDFFNAGGYGMGLMTMISAYEREYEPREEIKDRIIDLLELYESLPRYHGAWAHFYNLSTRQPIPLVEGDNGADVPETSFVAAGLIALKNYFTNDDPKSVLIREKADAMWKSIDWNWFRNDGENVLYWHWSPDYGYQIGLKIQGWNECLITYIMAASSPTHSIPKEVYTEGWAGNGSMVNKRTVYGYDISLTRWMGSPLYWIHYSHLGVNPQGLKDQYCDDYWQEYVNTAKIHYEYAIDNPLGHTNYSDKCWGLTSSANPEGYGYKAHHPMYNDDGTVAPTAALSSMPYTPIESMKALKYFYRERGHELFDRWGPLDAFNDNLNWVSDLYIDIDQAPIMIMIENYRTGLLWNLVTQDSDVMAGLEKLGFNYGTTASSGETRKKEIVKVYPNPTRDGIFIKNSEIDLNQPVELSIYGLDGRLIQVKSLEMNGGSTYFDCSNLSNGLYFITLKNKDRYFHGKLIVEK